MDELLIGERVSNELPQTVEVYSPGAQHGWRFDSCILLPCANDCKKHICCQVDTCIILRYQRIGKYWKEVWMCISCTPKLTQHFEQKRTRRYYTYLVFAKIHPDIAQYAIQHWNYSIPDIKYYQ